MRVTTWACDAPRCNATIGTVLSVDLQIAGWACLADGHTYCSKHKTKYAFGITDAETNAAVQAILLAHAPKPVPEVEQPKPHQLGCTCGEVKVGGVPTGHFNWNPDCPVHPWDEHLQAQNDRAVAMQRLAREAREAHRAAEPKRDRAPMPAPPGNRRGHEPGCESLYGDYHCTCQ